jgi:DNA polymerase
MANDKQAKLDELKQEISAQHVCPELAATATQLVFGDGSPDADIVLIGEAPGRQEDEQGKPFVGASGKFLDEMLGMINLRRSDIYITNIVKYRPPNNRDPSPAEKQAFLPYLIRQLNIIEPKLIVTLGRHSMDVHLPGLKISQAHGQPQRTNGRDWGLVVGSKGNSPIYHLPSANYLSWVILPLYHPAAALYNGGMRQTLIDDFATIPDILKKI